MKGCIVIHELMLFQRELITCPSHSHLWEGSRAQIALPQGCSGGRGPTGRHAGAPWSSFQSLDGRSQYGRPEKWRLEVKGSVYTYINGRRRRHTSKGVSSGCTRRRCVIVDVDVADAWLGKLLQRTGLRRAEASGGVRVMEGVGAVTRDGVEASADSLGRRVRLRGYVLLVHGGRGGSMRRIVSPQRCR
jgi:hypothetical protein